MDNILIPARLLLSNLKAILSRLHFLPNLVDLFRRWSGSRKMSWEGWRRHQANDEHVRPSVCKLLSRYKLKVKLYLLEAFLSLMGVKG